MKTVRWRGSVLRQFWLWFVIVLLLNQIAMLGGVYFFLFRPAVASFSSLTASLVDAGYRQQNGSSEPGLGIISERWVSNDHIIIVPGEISGLEPLPPYPGLIMIRKRVEQLLGAQVRVGFKSEPEKTLWIEYHAARPFAVGIPMAQRLLGANLLLVAFGGVVLISGLAAWLIARHLTRPLAHLSDMARRLGQGENVGEIAVDEDSPSEIGRLAEALNQMRQEIDQMLQERERFLAGIAHDLRTPLTRMGVALALSESPQSELSDGLRDDIEEMRTILDQFIELSRLDMEQSEPSQPADLNAIVQDLVEKYARAGETLEIDLGEVPIISLKPVALKRLLYNLIDNALRYGEGVVAIQTRLTEQRQLCVSVTNLHLDAVRPPALLAALRSNPNGQQSGLGLAIVRRLAEVHEANMHVLYEPDGNMRVDIVFKTDL